MSQFRRMKENDYWTRMIFKLSADVSSTEQRILINLAEMVILKLNVIKKKVKSITKTKTRTYGESSRSNRSGSSSVSNSSRKQIVHVTPILHGLDWYVWVRVYVCVIDWL